MKYAILMLGIVAVLLIAGCTGQSSGTLSARDCGNDLIKSAPCFSDRLVQCVSGTKAEISSAMADRSYELLGNESGICKIKYTVGSIQTVEETCSIAQKPIEKLPDINGLMGNCTTTGVR